MKKVGSGGSRPGAGRKPSKDPKIQVAFYLETSIVVMSGGMRAAREIAAAAIRRKSLKNN